MIRYELIDYRHHEITESSFSLPPHHIYLRVIPGFFLSTLFLYAPFVKKIGRQIASVLVLTLELGLKLILDI